MKTSRPAAAAAAIATLALLAGCGQSKSDKAASKVCDARSDIQQQVTNLKKMNLSTASTDDIKTSLTAIKGDFQTIADAQSDLNTERKSQVKQANDAFKAQLGDVASTLRDSKSASTAQQQLQTGLTQLADSYQQALAKVSCP